MKKTTFTVTVAAIVTAISIFLVADMGAIASTPTPSGMSMSTHLREAWNRSFIPSNPGVKDAYAVGVQQTPDGGYIVAGVAGYASNGDSVRSDFLLLKTDSEGQPYPGWVRLFGGYTHDIGYAAQQTADGGYILAGATCSFGAGLSDAWLVKTSSSGEQEWEKTFGHSDQDWGCAVQQTSDGGYVLAGVTFPFGAGASDAWL